MKDFKFKNIRNNYICCNFSFKITIKVQTYFSNRFPSCLGIYSINSACLNNICNFYQGIENKIYNGGSETWTKFSKEILQNQFSEFIIKII